jgi:hypothetical protein
MFFFRDDENDKSDDDEEGRIDFSINTFAKERQKIHNDFLAVAVERGYNYQTSFM